MLDSLTCCRTMRNISSKLTASSPANLFASELMGMSPLTLLILTASEMVSATCTYILQQSFPLLAHSVCCPSFSFCWDIIPKQYLNYFFFHVLILHLFRSATLLIRQFYETFLKHLAHSSRQRLHYFIAIFFKRAASTTW